jgi:thioredoxin reductase (NADPH)
MTQSEFDVVIVGGGPAGMSAAMWCAELGMSAVLLEKEAELGGQLLITHNPITNYLGTEAKNGRELRDVFAEQLKRRDYISYLNADVSGINVGERTVSLQGEEPYRARAIILATGARRRTLGIPGEAEFRGKGILESGSNAGDAIGGKRVLIVGGGDAALENALILSEKAAHVFLAHRRDEFRGRAEFIQAAAARPNIEMLTATAIQSISGNEIVETSEIKDLKTGETRTLPIDAVLIRIGVAPNTELLSEPPASAGGFPSEPGAVATGLLALDSNGYILIDSRCQTNIPGIYAIGDVANPTAPTISTAAGMGATAAKAIFAWLNAETRL